MQRQSTLQFNKLITKYQIIMNDINTFGFILFLIGIAIIGFLIGYAIFIHFGLLGLIIYIASTCIFSGSACMMMD